MGLDLKLKVCSEVAGAWCRGRTLQDGGGWRGDSKIQMRDIWVSRKIARRRIIRGSSSY